MKEKTGKTKYKKLEKLYTEIIKENNIIFLDEIFAFADISPSDFFNSEFDKSASIKDAIDINRAKLKRDLRFKWFESTNATLNAALYKLVCSEEEKRSLSSSAAKNTQQKDICTQEEYLKSLKEMSEGIEENAD